jgi:hypothetical protein
VTNPEEADYFLVPVWVSSAMWQMNWGFRDLLPTGVRAIKEATAYIRSTWPHFDRNGGADHLWVFGHDQGSWRIRTKVPEIAAGIFISPFGGGSAQRGGHRGGHTVGGVTEPQHDIVVPPLLYADVPKGLLNHKGRRKVSPQNLAFFQGKLNLHIPYASRSPGTLCLGERLTYGGGHFCHRYEYSFGVRQSLFKTHRNTPRIVIKEGHEADREEYFANMAGSKFCVAAAGFGFSTRAYEAALAGCAPLVMQDGIPQAFEDLLPWPLFSLRLNDSLAQIPSLAAQLEAVPEETVRAMRSRLYCVWPRLIWLRHDRGARTPLPDAEGLLEFDAFESMVWTLRKRLRKDIGWPPDWDEGCRAVSRYFATPPQGVTPHRWAPWANVAFDTPRL